MTPKQWRVNKNTIDFAIGWPEEQLEDVSFKEENGEGSGYKDTAEFLVTLSDINGGTIIHLLLIVFRATAAGGVCAMG
ncbi:hypothetical protein CDAR_43091 [Caerostris darwini]|uniref:Uncharacterized protein n=1 Tax=Caerostris darwini TaxID=1538125 RepID=A0AAV4WG97_9ARAC|nr:hypothetical protein CDAR_43091 [Caerostris darwini]